MSKRAAERLNLELAAFIRVDFSGIPFPHLFFPHFTSSQSFPSASTRSRQEIPENRDSRNIF